MKILRDENHKSKTYCIDITFNQDVISTHKFSGAMSHETGEEQSMIYASFFSNSCFIQFLMINTQQ